jgi:tetratricopeptide (TPR) repeat protein
MAELTPFLELPIATQSADAASAILAGQDSIVQRRSNAMMLLSQAREADPNSAYIQSVFGLMLIAARKKALLPQITEALNLAQANAKGISKREQNYVAALQASVGANPLSAANIFEAILEDNPFDLLALTFLQGELFWAGKMDRSAKASQRLEKHWQADVPGYAAYLASRAFDLEEVNQLDKAEQKGRLAIDIDSSNVWAAHAVAHVLYMQNRSDDGLDWLTQLNANWQDANQLQFHLWWHHCLFLIEQKDNDKVLDLYDSHVRNLSHPLTIASPDLFLDLQNSASLLWRLETAGADVGDRWWELSAIVKPRIDDLSSPFTSAHIALVLAATNDYDALAVLQQTLSEYVVNNKTELAYSVEAAIPVVKAVAHYYKNEHHQVVDTLLPHLNTLHLMGGSHAQQDVFYQLLFDSVKRTGNTELAGQLHHQIEAIGFHEPANRVMYSA